MSGSSISRCMSLDLSWCQAPESATQSSALSQLCCAVLCCAQQFRPMHLEMPSCRSFGFQWVSHALCAHTIALRDTGSVAL